MNLHQCPYFLQEEGNLSPSSTALGWTAELSVLASVFAGRFFQTIVAIKDDVKLSTDSDFLCMICYFRVSFLTLLGNHQEKNNLNARQHTKKSTAKSWSFKPPS